MYQKGNWGLDTFLCMYVPVLGFNSTHSHCCTQGLYFSLSLEWIPTRTRAIQQSNIKPLLPDKVLAFGNWTAVGIILSWSEVVILVTVLDSGGSLGLEQGCPTWYSVGVYTWGSVIKLLTRKLVARPACTITTNNALWPIHLCPN